MGRDNQPKDRQKRTLARKQGKREPYERILIVCEGKKTEPNYFNDIRRHYRLSSAHIKALPSERGRSPQQVVDFAYDYCNKEKIWETVFCVFDRDNYRNFESAISSVKAKDQKITNDQGKKVHFFAIPSDPCFELWFTLHYREVLSEIQGPDVLKLLKKDMPEYEKNLPDMFARTEIFLENAYKNVARLAGNRNEQKITNPFTAVDEVVKKLCGLRAKR
jgi:hypothetical protein